MIVRYGFRARRPNPRILPRQDRRSSPDDFLLSVVGIQHSGVALTVNSMLAQLGLDPWAEATYLLSCPASEALARLETFIQAAPIPTLTTDETIKLASNLLRLLYASKAERRPTKFGADLYNHTTTSAPFPNLPQTPKKPEGRTVHVRMGRGDWIRILIVVMAAVMLFVIGLVDPHSLLSGYPQQASAPKQSQASSPANTR